MASRECSIEWISHSLLAIYYSLFGNLELSGLNDFSVAIPQLNNVDAAIKFIQIESGFWRNIFLLINHFAKKIKNLDIVTLLITFF